MQAAELLPSDLADVKEAPHSTQGYIGISDLGEYLELTGDSATRIAALEAAGYQESDPAER